MKIGIGTVQWGLDYGISNRHGIPSDIELDSMVSLATQNGIELYDTALQYGNAEQRLSRYITNSSKIVSKFSLENSTSVEKQLILSLSRLNVEQLYGYLFHSPKDLINDPNLWKQMLALKEKRLVQKIGYSLYYPQELTELLDKEMIPDIVQLPYSLLDRKFEPYFERLKSFGVEIHIRSVFLQGLYFKSIDTLSSSFESIKTSLEELRKIKVELNLSIVELALNFVLQNRYVDYVIVGVEQIEQLEEILNASKIYLSKSIIDRVYALTVKDKTLLNPSNWK